MEHIDHYRAASPNDYDALLKLLPQLADFEIPIRRVAKDLWEGDAALLKEVLEKKSRVTFADVAVDSNDQIQGVIRRKSCAERRITAGLKRDRFRVKITNVI